MSVEPTTIRIDVDSDTPAYRQIVDALRTHLVSGRIRPGETLPPVRQISQHPIAGFTRHLQGPMVRGGGPTRARKEVAVSVKKSKREHRD